MIRLEKLRSIMLLALDDAAGAPEIPEHTLLMASITRVIEEIRHYEKALRRRQAMGWIDPDAARRMKKA